MLVVGFCLLGISHNLPPIAFGFLQETTQETLDGKHTECLKPRG